MSTPIAAATSLRRTLGVKDLVLLAPLPAFLHGWTSLFVIASGSIATLVVAFSGDPQRTFPRAITAATAALIVTYLLASFGYIAALGPDAAASTDHIAADAVGALLGPGAGKLVGALIFVSIFSATNGLMLTAPRMYYAMARDGVFFERLAVVDERFGTPAFAIIAIAAWAAVLAVSGTFEPLLTYVVFTGWIFTAWVGGRCCGSARRSRMLSGHFVSRAIRLPRFCSSPRRHCWLATPWCRSPRVRRLAWP
ncbi:MAG: amino acid permease [Gemmatimonadetes bacterium]|nr:amino acid permease [Gemmatimonadota bacterium]